MQRIRGPFVLMTILYIGDTRSLNRFILYFIHICILYFSYISHIFHLSYILRHIYSYISCTRNIYSVILDDTFDLN